MSELTRSFVIAKALMTASSCAPAALARRAGSSNQASSQMRRPNFRPPTITSGKTHNTRHAGMPFASFKIIAWLQRNSAAVTAAATSNAGACDHSANPASGKKAAAIQASRAIHERCGWRKT